MTSLTVSTSQIFSIKKRFLSYSSSTKLESNNLLCWFHKLMSQSFSSKIWCTNGPDIQICKNKWLSQVELFIFLEQKISLSLFKQSNKKAFNTLFKWSLMVIKLCQLFLGTVKSFTIGIFSAFSFNTFYLMIVAIPLKSHILIFP